MDGGVRVELRIDSPDECPIADASAVTEGTGRSVCWSADPGADRVIEEFVLESAPDGAAPDLTTVSESVEPVFTDSDSQIYRFDRGRHHECPCASVERFGYPVADIEARDGCLFVTFHVPEVDEVRSILSDLRSKYAGMSVERIIRSETAQEDSKYVHVDRSVLTERQAEVLRTALEMGYFERPKKANAGEVADELGINRATFAEHLAASQRKLLPTIVGD